MTLAKEFGFVSLDTNYFECCCHSPEHTLRATWDGEDNDVYFSLFLSTQRAWWKRVIVAVGYIFGYRCKYGDWDEFILQSTDTSKLISLLQMSKKEVVANEIY
jgi:hypothetical protein